MVRARKRMGKQEDISRLLAEGNEPSDLVREGHAKSTACFPASDAMLMIRPPSLRLITSDTTSLERMNGAITLMR